MSFNLPPEATGLRLGKYAADDMVLCEKVIFPDGSPAVDTVLRRAAISGRVERDGKIIDHFADVLDKEGDIIETIALDANSYRALKTRWMRCRVEPPLLERARALGLRK